MGQAMVDISKLKFGSSLITMWIEATIKTLLKISDFDFITYFLSIPIYKENNLFIHSN
jgi:hypothetical protein